MESALPLLLGTIALRPYVFAFLLVYLLGCSLHLGVKRAVLFCAAGYFIAWTSELSSIHNGIPYGLYYYIPHTKDRELWLMGVPFMDSLSYVFLAYASYSMALMVISPITRLKGTLYLLETRALRRSLAAKVFGALFLVYLDIIIDPVALQGHKWFLGRIYGYPEGGDYFGVPISNFIGWFATGFLMISALQEIDNYLHRKGVRDYTGYRYPRRYLIGLALYCGVLLFNLAVTFAIREYTVGWTGIFIILLPSVLFHSLIRQKLTLRNPDEAFEAHLADFPLAELAEPAVAEEIRRRPGPRKTA
ncbi:MAG TPA: carotenoid biosynthesis protein [Dissulfurispiraceae bacterium]